MLCASLSRVANIALSRYLVVWLSIGCGKVFLVLGGNVVLIFLVPLLQVGSHFGVDVAVLVDKVHALIHVDDDVEKQLHAAPCLKYGGYHGHTQLLAQHFKVYGVAAFLKLVVHV